MNKNLVDIYKEKPTFMKMKDKTIVKNFGNLKEEYNALRNGSVIYDYSSFGLFSVSGENSTDFLNYLVTKDIQFLTIGQSTECLFLNKKAEIIAYSILLKRENDYLLIVPYEHDLALYEWLKENKQPSITLKKLNDIYSLISVEGSQSWRLMKCALDLPVSEISLHYSSDFTILNSTVTVIRIGRSNEYGYMLMANYSVIKELYLKILNHIDSLEFPIKEAGWDCVELGLLETHLPNFYRETSDYGNIIELSQQWFVQYDKEEFIGKKALLELLEISEKKNTVGFVLQENIKENVNNEFIFDNDKKIGQVIYSAYSFKLKAIVGIALLDNPYPQSGLTLQLGQNKNIIKTLSSPYVRPLSWDTDIDE
jgi:aminomethyltransferase